MPAWTNNPFWRPGNWYGGTNVITGAPQDWYNTEYSRLDSTLNRGEYERFLTEQGFGGFDRTSTLARRLEGRADTGYQAAQLSNPDLSYRDYLNTLEGGWLNDAIAQMSAAARGDNTPGQTRRILWG